MAIKVTRYEGDFETTTDPNDVRVWASCLVNIETCEVDFIGNGIHDFFEFLKNRNSIVYKHNLKFDGEFILSYVLRVLKFKYSEKKEAGTFNCLITDDGLFYMIEVIFEKKNKKYKKVTFYDSLKKLPFKVSVIAKAFELEDRKLHIDYEAYRPEDHVLTKEEEDYIIADCKIVAQALKIQFAQGLNRMTNASDALNGYKEIIGKKRFEQWFPVLPLHLDADLRRAYKGGYVYLNPKFKNKRVPLGLVFDVNSLYPDRMYNCLLPYGYPVYFEGEYEPDERYPLYIVRLKCGFKLKKDHLPTIQLKNNRSFIETEYLTSSNGEIVELTLTNVDLQLMKEHYDLFCEEYECGWKFKGAVGMFKEYIEYWSHVKETSTGGRRQLAKLQLNSLYGKFASATDAKKKWVFLDRDEIVHYEVITEKVARENGLEPPEPRDPVYTAMACFITAYAREKTIRAAQKVYPRFIYADTDSLHICGDEIPEELEIHKTHLGAWKHEGTFIDSKYIRAKTYMETMLEHTEKLDLKSYARPLSKTFDVWKEENGITWHETKVTCAGMPDNVKEQVNYDNFESGNTFDGKLMPKRYKGGIVLTPTTFTIK